MTPEQIIQQTLGAKEFQIAVLQSQVEQLQQKLKEYESNVSGSD